MSSNKLRDNFSERTKKLLASRVAYRCCSPECSRPTTGPANYEGASINIGVAAHITAASAGGPRFDPHMTTEERSDQANGIWLCQSCAKIIDSDVEQFTALILRQWKSDAIARSKKALFGGIQRPPELPRFEYSSIQMSDSEDTYFSPVALGLSSTETAESVLSRIIQAAKIDIANFRGVNEWPLHPIALHLILTIDGDSQNITLEGLANGIGISDIVNIVSPPGTGKSTTLIQLSETILSISDKVPALIPLAEWSDYPLDFFSYILRRSSFSEFSSQHFKQLALNGRLVLVVDGWNELDPDSQLKALREVKALRRDFPLLGLVVGTRRQSLPISGPIVEIQALSDDQQMELASARGERGQALLDEAWRTPGVRDLVSVPLYLNALLGIAKGSVFPRTKGEVLDIFVKQHEMSSDKAVILDKVLHGLHRNMLTGIAVDANNSGSTVLTVNNAYQSIAKICKLFSIELPNPPTPKIILDTLVNSHLLVRPSDNEQVHFQHQQFLEWFASFEIERLMLEPLTSVENVDVKILSRIFDNISWEESILFAIERISRGNTVGKEAAANSIRGALFVDPMLAAEMIHRSSPEVWEVLKLEVISFVNRWHHPRSVDRALRFMIISGQSDFASLIWPLISEGSDSNCYDALRIAPRFRPSVLGEDAIKLITALPTKRRASVVSEIASRSGFDGMKLAAEIAKSDQSTVVVLEIISALYFRRADRFVNEILNVAADDVWNTLAKTQYIDSLTDEKLNLRLNNLQKIIVATETQPGRALSLLIEMKALAPDDQEKITTLIRSPIFPLEHAHSSVLHRAYELYPNYVTKGLIARLESGLSLPYHADEYLKGLKSFDDGPISVAALNRDTPDALARSIHKLIGPKTVIELIKQHLAADNQNEAQRKEFKRLMYAITAAPDSSFYSALEHFSYLEHYRSIQLIFDLVHRRSQDNSENWHIPTIPNQTKLVQVFKVWIELLLNSSNFSRHELSSAAFAIGELRSNELLLDLQRILDRDLCNWMARDRNIRSVTQFNPQPYQQAFTKIGGEITITLMETYLKNLDFGTSAARVLSNLWNTKHPSDKKKLFSSWPDFSEVKLRRLQRELPNNVLSTCDVAESIFRAVAELITVQDDAAQLHALSLAKIGLMLPHGEDRTEIAELILLPQSLELKHELFVVLAMTGRVLSSDMILNGLYELLEKAKIDRWLLDDSYRTMRWIQLFPFSDRPSAGLDALRALPATHIQPSNLMPLLTALSNSPHPEILPVLVELPKMIPSFYQDYDWLRTLVALESVDAATFVLDLVCDEKLDLKRSQTNFTRSIPNHLAALAVKLPSFKEKLIRRYEHMNLSIPRSIIELALIEIPDESIILKLIESYAKHGKAYDERLYFAIRNIAVGKKKHEEWFGSYEEFSVSLSSFRKTLIDIVGRHTNQSQIAAACLTLIEELRDGHGRISEEHRHPNIESGIVWPSALVEVCKTAN